MLIILILDSVSPASSGSPPVRGQDVAAAAGHTGMQNSVEYLISDYY